MSNDQQAEPTQDPVEQMKHTYEHMITNLTQKQEELEKQIVALHSQIETDKKYIAGLHIKLEVLNDQRTTLTTQLTTSQINHKTEVRDMGANFKAELANKDAAHKIQLAAQHQGFASQQRDLTETMHKFGQVKHDLHQQRSKTDELTSLLNWFIELTSEFNGSIQRELGELLTLDSLRLAKERMPIAKGLSKKKVLALFK